MSTHQKNSISRAPVVVVMGHIDHGKSTLLDYIRKSNIVDKEAGGITQHISAYEVIHKDEHGADRRITFLDTPGHEAFSGMRVRGAQTAEIAILVVSAEDGVKTQTLEAYETIIKSKVPYIVAINKIDKPGANPEKTKNDLVEHGIYIEGFGGDIPFAEISAKTGQGVDQLLSLVLLVTDMNEYTADISIPAVGIVIESNMDKKRGVSASLIIKDGILEKGMFVVAEGALTTTRIMENFLGKTISEALPSQPVRLIGFDKLPPVGSVFQAYRTKKEAEKAQAMCENSTIQTAGDTTQTTQKTIPLIIKTDVYGTAEAIEKEVRKMATETISFRILQKGVGAIGEADIKLAGGSEDAVIVGFNVGMDASVRDFNEKQKVTIETFEIIYKLTDWLKELIEARRPRVETTEIVGKLKVIKTFSRTKDRQVLGGKVIEGKFYADANVRIMRREGEIGKGSIVELQQSKSKAREVDTDTECGLMIETKIDIAPGDVLEAILVKVL
jgi:translation initiation factor IF-2